MFRRFVSGEKSCGWGRGAARRPGCHGINAIKGSCAKGGIGVQAISGDVAAAAIVGAVDGWPVGLTIRPGHTDTGSTRLA